MSDKRVCCICGKDMTNEFPNNPWPFGEPEEDACAACNSNYVTPIRGWISTHNINEAVKATLEHDAIIVSRNGKQIARLIRK